MILGNSWFSPLSHNMAVTRMLHEVLKLSQGGTNIEHRRKNGNMFSSCGLSDGRQILVPVLWFGHILSLFLCFCLNGAGMTVNLASALCSRKRQREWLLSQHVCARICLNPYAVITGSKHCELFPWQIRQKGQPSHPRHLQIKLGSS